MTGERGAAVRGRRGEVRLTRREIWALLAPIFKRVPAYVRLGWALLRDRRLARRHKSLLYFTIIYTLSPLHMLLGPIPVVAQVDSLVLLLLGIRQALAHCPPEAVDRHLDRFGLPRRQMDRDLNVAVSVAGYTLSRLSGPVGRNVAFGGRVAAGFGRRLVGRLLPHAEPAPPKRLVAPRRSVPRPATGSGG
jgi:hypothetical protein